MTHSLNGFPSTSNQPQSNDFDFDLIDFLYPDRISRPLTVYQPELQTNVCLSKSTCKHQFEMWTIEDCDAGGLEGSLETEKCI